MTDTQAPKVKWFGPAVRRRELGTLTEMQKIELVRIHNQSLKGGGSLGLEARRIGTDTATAEAFLKRQPGYPGEIARKSHRALQHPGRVSRAKPPAANAEPAVRRKQSPSLPRVSFLERGHKQGRPDFADYHAGLNGQRCYELALREIRLNGIREGRFAPRRDNEEEMAAAREAGLVVEQPAAHRVSA